MSAIAAGLRSILPEPTQQPFQEDTSDKKTGHSKVGSFSGTLFFRLNSVKKNLT